MSCFNSRTREGATLDLKELRWQYGVSIHAPVKVRRNVGIESQGKLYVSIHAPVKVRPHKRLRSPEDICFNSRTREGATKKRVIQYNYTRFQFTHP